MQIAQTDFSSGGCRPQDCMKMTQEYLMYFKEFSCNKTENMQVRCVPRFIQRFPKYMAFQTSIECKKSGCVLQPLSLYALHIIFKYSCLAAVIVSVNRIYAEREANSLA